MAFSPNLAKAAAANFHDSRQFVGRIRAVVPEMREWMRAARRACVFVGDIDESRLRRVVQDDLEPRAFRGGVGKLAIAVVDGDLVPESDVHAVGLR